MAELVKLERVKTFLEISQTDTAQDTLLGDLIRRVSAWVERYCDRTFTKATYTEQYDGDGTDRLLLNQWPIVSVATLHDDTDRAFGASTLIAASDYVLYKDRGLIRLDGLTFSIGIQNVKVVYDAGYATIPEDLQQAVIQLVGKAFRHKENEGVKSLSIGAYSVTYDPGKDDLPDEVRAVLDSYAKVRVA